MNSITLVQKQEFTNRVEIRELLGGNPQSGITMATKIAAILLFKNEDELYSDYFYPRGPMTTVCILGLAEWDIKIV